MATSRRNFLNTAGAAVVYSVPFVPQGGAVQFPGMGLSFQEIDEKARTAIRGFVTRERFKKGLGMEPF